MTEEKQEDYIISGNDWDYVYGVAKEFPEVPNIDARVRSRPYDIDAIKAAEKTRLLEEIGLNCFGEYQMNNRRCIICQVGERCYDKRESLREGSSCDSQDGG